MDLLDDCLLCNGGGQWHDWLLMLNWLIVLSWFALMSVPAFLTAWLSGDPVLITVAALVGWVGGGWLMSERIERIISRPPGSSPSRR